MAYDFGAAFARIEAELIDSMMRNLRRYHLDWEDAEGFDWTQWQVEQLASLEEYRRTNADEFGPQFTSINAAIREAIEHGYQNGQREEELRILDALAKDERFARGMSGGVDAGFFRVNDRKLDALLTATHSDMERAEWAVLRRADDQYRQIIFNAQMYANTGAGTIEKAVDMATKDFLMRGIDCIEYRNGARHTISDYADMAIRTAERRAYLYGEGQKRQAWGLSLVIVNKRGGHPCPECAKWIGKILIDDVYSGGKPDGKHTLLSEAMAQGFLHPRCKDGFTTYFPGISKTPDPVTVDELQEAAQAEAEETRRQNAERMAEKWDRRAKYSLDPNNRRAARAHAEEWRSQFPTTKMSASDVSEEYVKSAMPGQGSITYEPGYARDKRHEAEISMAGWIHDTYGGDVILLKESGDRQEKRADYLWRGSLWDLKTPTTIKAADDRIRHGAKQIQDNPGGIILDYTDCAFNLDQLKEVVDSRARRVAINSFDVIVISQRRMVAIWRYKK